MPYPIQGGNPFMVQQSVSGTGVFNGSDYGRAKGEVPSNTPNATVQIAARLYGTAPNAYTVAFVDSGPGSTVPVTTAQQLGAAITVVLRRDASLGILATAAEVSDAINRANVGVAATYVGNGNGVVDAYAPTPINGLVSGVDPAVRGPNDEQFLWYLPANVSAGLFYFEQTETLAIQQFEALFTVPGGTHTVAISRVNLNAGLVPILTEAVSVFVWGQLTTATPDIAVSGISLLLHPQQALRVTTSGPGLAGVVRFDVRKSNRYPYP